MADKVIFSLREPGVCDLVYQSLNAAERTVYRKLTEYIAACEKNFTFEGILPETLERAYEAVRLDHPEFFWITGGGVLRTQRTVSGSASAGTVTFTPDFPESEEVIRRKYTALKKSVKSIAFHAGLRRKLFDRVLYVHDYLVDHTRYDHTAAARIGSVFGGSGIPDASTAYGCLVKHQAICSGYAAAFQLVMQELGIVCGRVSGTADGGRHAWNILQLDNEWYCMDVTWDDPTSRDGKDNKSYEYFCVTTDELLRTHTPNGDREVPECFGRKYNYHRYKGYYMGIYSRQRALDILHAQAKKEEITMRFSSAEERERAAEDLITNGGIWKRNLRGIKSQSLTYSRGSSGLVLTISLKSE